MTRKLLLLSSSKVGATPYLSHALDLIKTRLGEAKEVLFIPYAGVTVNYDQYTEQVAKALKEIDVTVKGIHTVEEPKAAVKSASAILVGGGNTFRLLERLYYFDLIEEIQNKVSNSCPYIGWSAGSNMTGNSIKTTNDMPIIEPPSFNALNLVDCQLNPHYTEYQPPGFNGETREQRLQEFMVLNPETNIIGLVEGTGLMVDDASVTFVKGSNIEESLYLFKGGEKQVVDTFPSDLKI